MPCKINNHHVWLPKKAELKQDVELLEAEQKCKFCDEKRMVKLQSKGSSEEDSEEE